MRKLPEHIKRTKNIVIRASQLEYERVDALMKKRGFYSMAEYIRSLVDEDYKKDLQAKNPWE